MKNPFSTVVYQVITHPRVAEFAQKYRFPGWYIDSNGCYCCSLGKYLISIFFNDEDANLNIAVDGISNLGWYDQNVEWESPEDDEALIQTTLRFMYKYASFYKEEKLWNPISKC